jgi:3-hydroxyacyl-CoA dehydrogenase
MASIAGQDTAKIALVGAGTIGLSFAALHLSHLQSASQLTIIDTRPDLESHVKSTLPRYLPSSQHGFIDQINLTSSLEAVSTATIIQESGPENLEFKILLWTQVEKLASPSALFWSSTSGIPASQQATNMIDKSRLMVVHPYNPPHVMPLLELVPSPATSAEVISQTMDFWKGRGRQPVLIKKECTGFVANRLAFALLRESIHLVSSGVVTIEELDSIVETSMGPRWAVAGPFKSYHAGGGAGGLAGFFGNIGGTVQSCWDDAGTVSIGDGWENDIFTQARDAYGVVNIEQRDEITRKVLSVVRNEKSKTE